MTFFEYLTRLDEITADKWIVLFFLCLAGIALAYCLFNFLRVWVIGIREMIPIAFSAKRYRDIYNNESFEKIKKVFTKAIFGFLATQFFLFCCWLVEY